jgi:hypothetical protein
VDVLLLLFWGTALSTARTLFGGTLIIMLIVDGATLAFVAGHPNSFSCFARLLLFLLFVFCTNLCARGSQTLVLGRLYLWYFQQFIGPAYPLRPLNCRWKLHAIICSRYPLLSWRTTVRHDLTLVRATSPLLLFVGSTVWADLGVVAPL